MPQVSELSHKLGTVEGNCRSMEEELSRLQNQNVQLGKSKSEREVEANELRARLRSADEKVHISLLMPSITKQHLYTLDNMKPVKLWWLRSICRLPGACITAAYMSARYRPLSCRH
jgi:TolA-binding protein